MDPGIERVPSQVEVLKELYTVLLEAQEYFNGQGGHTFEEYDRLCLRIDYVTRRVKACGLFWERDIN